MKFSFRSLVVKPTARVVSQLREQIGSLGSLIAVESADAILERMHAGKGAFRLRVHLAVPGPDLHAESTGYTVAEAVMKMKKGLVRQIGTRRLRRSEQRTLKVRRPGAHGN